MQQGTAALYKDERENPVNQVIELIRRKMTAGRCLLVTIDGPCASGKTTLAERLAGAFGAPVVHTDDYVIPHAQKTKERLAVPGGNCDVLRLVREVIAPWKRGEAVCVRRYDCMNDCILPGEPLPSASLLILEGSYCNLPEIRQYADLCLFLNTPWAVRDRRLRERESAESLKCFYERWIPLEDAYFEAYHLPDESCIILEDTPEEAVFPTDPAGEG